MFTLEHKVKHIWQLYNKTKTFLLRSISEPNKNGNQLENLKIKPLQGKNTVS
jgi:hypothetical protein